MTDQGNDPDQTDDATQAAEDSEAQASHEADRPPTPEEEAAAERIGTKVPETVADAYQEAAQTGAAVEGEGSI